ncbi:hypothetical protein DB30_05737 [Enhygromyxa salina]|uniref:HEAT repeat protein n=1 Tax=Enhygromyxa salina TaxID=215803 RepID=A0A0C2D0E7_9BACT|nr:hypothetical protein DB30_05737 [Enhygromyxa salina]
MKVALGDPSTVTLVHEALERRDPDGAAARLLSDAYARGQAPGWLVAVLLGGCRHMLGYQTVRAILLDAPGSLAESYAGPALVRIAGPAALDDLIEIQSNAPRRDARDGAAYGLGKLGSPEALDAVLAATMSRKIRWRTGAYILGNASPDEGLVLELLASGDAFRTRLATEIAWACVVSVPVDATDPPALEARPSAALLDALEPTVSTMSVNSRKREVLAAWLRAHEGRARPVSGDLDSGRRSAGQS